MAQHRVNRLSAWLAAWLLLAASAVGAAEARRLVFIIFDSSPGTRYLRKEMLAVAEGTLAELKPDDRLWVIAGHPNRGRLLHVGTMGTDEQLIREARQKLRAIKAKLFWPSDLAAALAAPLETLRQGEAGQQRHVLIIVITDGRLSETRTNNLLSAAGKAKAQGAAVIVTGVKDTSPGLLAAAAEDRIQWTLLSKCDPGRWLKRTTENHEDGRGEQRTSASSEQQESCDRTVVDRSWNNWFVFPRDRWDSSSPSGGQPGSVFSDAQKEAGPPSPSLAVVPKSPAPQLTDSRTIKEKVGRATPSTSDGPKPKQEGDARSSSLSLLFLREVTSSGWLIAGLILLAILSVPAVLLARNYAQSRSQRNAPPAGQLRRVTRERDLAAIVNGLEHSLGREGSVSRIRIGRDAGNSIVVSSRDVERNHVELTRRNGTWQLRNLSANPVEVNHVTVPARGRQPIFFPADIKLSPTASIRLVLRPHVSREAGNAAQRGASESSPQQRSPQPATA